MPTQRQLEANKTNAKKGGPKTPEGKAIVATNAITHGFSAEGTVFPCESSNDYQSLLAQFEEEFQPKSASEKSLVRQLADADWRLRRAATFESAVLLRRIETARRNMQYTEDYPENPDLDEACLLGRALIEDAFRSDPLSKISRHEARLTRRFFKTLSHLRKLRKDAESRAAGGNENRHPPST